MVAGDAPLVDVRHSVLDVPDGHARTLVLLLLGARVCSPLLRGSSSLNRVLLAPVSVTPSGTTPSSGRGLLFRLLGGDNDGITPATAASARGSSNSRCCRLLRAQVALPLALDAARPTACRCRCLHCPLPCLPLATAGPWICAGRAADRRCSTPNGTRQRSQTTLNTRTSSADGLKRARRRWQAPPSSMVAGNECGTRGSRMACARSCGRRCDVVSRQRSMVHTNCTPI